MLVYLALRLVVNKYREHAAGSEKVSNGLNGSLMIMEIKLFRIKKLY